MKNPLNLVAVLSSTVLGIDGVYRRQEVNFPNIEGVVHFVGHPNTKALIEGLGAVPSTEKLFSGLEVGQAFLAVPLAQNPREEGWTKDTAVLSVTELKAVVITRVE
jgi:hypothetical protein